ncbi:hypothetical protein [Streptomyces sp. NPDC101166]|uniref:hypothetical protein n=1 Tax=Streptomyces sp. NPDC101166 TaxID=3366120 RepID=UPI00380A9131
MAVTYLMLAPQIVHDQPEFALFRLLVLAAAVSAMEDGLDDPHEVLREGVTAVGGGEVAGGALRREPNALMRLNAVILSCERSTVPPRGSWLQLRPRAGLGDRR